MGKRLSEFTADWRKRHSRYPTFWLDNVCIDQQNISQGLKVLPIHLMACRKMLVLSGPTYPTRLWCAWELLTLMEFEVADAHCYDPNEEIRLMNVIHIIGKDQFNQRIRTLASLLQNSKESCLW